MSAPNNMRAILGAALGGRLAAYDEEPPGRADVRVSLRGREASLTAIWAGSGAASDVERVAPPSEGSWPDQLVVVARRLSPAAVDVIERHGASWADASGRAHIVTRDLLVLRDAPQPLPDTRTSTWSPSATEIAEALLSRAWPEGIGTGSVARLTGWSPPQASEVLQRFDAEGWTRKAGPTRGPGARREIVDADALLESWSASLVQQPRERRLTHPRTDDLMAFLEETLAAPLESDVRWALGGWGAAHLMAPFASSVPTLQIHVAEDDFFGPLTEVMRRSELREVDEGGSVEFVSTPARALDWGTKTHGVPLASAPRTYVDLRLIGGRAADAAEHLREEVIRPLHQPFARRAPSRGITRWIATSRERLAIRRRDERRDSLFQHGFWTVAYRLVDPASTPSLAELADNLSAVVGDETGWPPWNPRLSPVEVVDDALEGSVRAKTFRDPAHADFWRADPQGRFFLARGYQEDGDIPGLEPGTTFDLTLPIWRIGECLRHAERISRSFDSERIEFAASWAGLGGRELASVAAGARVMRGGRTATQDEVTSAVELRGAALATAMPEIVATLLDPLYGAFHMFRPPESLYREELERLMSPPGGRRRPPQP